MKLQYLEATDSNGTELYLFQLEDGSFISVPKEQLKFKPLSPEELKEMKRTDSEVEAIPSADKPSGEWLKFGLGRGTRILFCTNCERRIEVPLSQGDSNYDFCPNCGARMKGEANETNY